MGSRNRLTPQWAADINASDPHDPESLAITQEYEALFRKEPLEALKHLRTLYELRDRCRLDIRLNNMCLVFAEELENGARMPSVAANLTMKTLVSAGLTELYFDMILEDDFFQEFSMWINNVFSGIFQIIQWSHTVKEERIAKIFIDKGPALWNHIWNSKDLLVRSDQLEIFDAKVREGLADLSLQYQILYYEKNAFPMLADSRVAHVGMLVWIHMEPDNPRSELFLRTVMVFTRHTRSIPEVLAFVKEAAINTVGPVRFLRRLHRALELESKIDKDLQSIVGAMAEYLHHPDVRSLLGTSGTHKALMNAVARQEKRGLQSFRFPITISAIRLLAGITQSTPLEIGAEPLLREHDMIGFIARSVVFCARKSCQEWGKFVFCVIKDSR
ncbi:hypothetical protein OF83DRAFT_1274564 [Amylostereum chailletii]|nr:hypothetical protein OF83DRAFT_1274564 [Amylostereum chailletii]